jgi:hypothetical protein
MRKLALLVVAVLSVGALVSVQASAHPDEKGEVYVPWMDRVDSKRLMRSFMSEGEQFTANAAPSSPGSSNMTLVGNSDKDGTTNSDLAFRGKLAYAGNYDGFRILDISRDQPRTVVDHQCRGPQNDVSFYDMGGKTFLFQSIDSGQTREDCSSVDAPVVDGGRVGYEGVRVFDVTNPRQPKFIDMIQTACGSHTHTVVPDGRQAYIYVSSYPLGTGITPPGAEGPGDYKACTTPHKKISIIKVSTSRGKFQHSLREKSLSDDTTFSNGFQACHDIQIFMPKKIAIGSCAGDGQIWDISNPGNPTSGNGERHTHIRSPSAADQFEFIHSGVVTWDGKKFAIMDETGGGGTAECDGSASQDGFYYFYKMVKPGQRAPKLEARFTIPRPQTPEICVSHNASVIPVKGRDIMTASYYQGGDTVVDFTDFRNVRERAYADLADETGLADSWSTYWYNGRAYANTGLNRRGATGNRGLDVFRIDLPGLGRAERWKWSNPQTQESFQVPGRDDDDDDDDD